MIDRIQALGEQLGIQQTETREEWLAKRLNACGVQWEVVEAKDGPQVTTFHINRASGELFNKAKRERVIAALGEEIHQTNKIALGESQTAHFSLVVPRDDRQYVSLDSIKNLKQVQTDAVLGVSINNEPVTLDIKDAPHVLIAGQTGGGKSVLLNSMIQSLMLDNSPDYLQFHMIDTKRVEFNQYENNPFVENVSYTVSDAMTDLDAVIAEMEGRYKILQHLGYASVYDIEDENIRRYMPTLVVVADEFSNLVSSDADSKKALEAKFARISEIGRASAVHLILATQSPRADVVSGRIRSCLPTKIGMRTTSQTETRIIGVPDCHKLLGKGDTLIQYANGSVIRFQAAKCEGV